MRFFDSYTWDDAERYLDEVEVSIQAILHGHGVLGTIIDTTENIRASAADDPERAEQHDELVTKLMGHVAEQRWNGLTMLPKKLR